MTSYTPGPWHVYNEPLRPSLSMTKIIEVQEESGAAVVAWAGFDDSDRAGRTHLANARLIAAAPEMADVLQTTFACLQSSCGEAFRDIHPATWRRLEAILAKIKGE